MDLFDRVGGLEGWHRLATAFYRRVEGDPVLRPMYGRSLRCPIDNIAWFMSHLSGGSFRFPLRYTHMRHGHRHFRIGIDERDRWVACMSAAVDETIDDPEIRESLRHFFAEAATQLVNTAKVTSEYAPFPCPAEADGLEVAWARLMERERLFDAGDLEQLRVEGLAEPEELLEYAAERGNREFVERLLAVGADASQIVVKGIWAAPYPDLAELLVRHGATPNARGDKRPPIIEAARGDKGEHPERVLALLRLGADVNAALPNGLTALHYAARSGHIRTLEILLAHGADASARDDKGATARDLALAKGKRAVAERLGQSGLRVRESVAD